MMRLAPIALLALIGCQDTQRTPGAFDSPSAIAVLEPATGGPFSQPVGYVANTDGGRISILALSSGTYLADADGSVLTRSSGLATGEGRRIGGLAVYTPEAAQVDLFATDKAFGHLLQVPHVVSLTEAGAPIVRDAVASTPEFIDTDSSGDQATLRDLVIYQGAAASEDWSVRFDGTKWWMEGSRSGRLPVEVTPGEVYTWDREDDIEGARLKPPVSFVLEGTATAGDEIRFSVDSGLIEHDLSGTPLQLAMSPDQQTLAVVVSEGGESRLDLIDPATVTVLSTVTLDAAASPGRMAWHSDGTLFAADNVRPAFWEVSSAGVATEHVLPFPTVDVAPLQTTANERLVYLVPVTSDAVWVYDLDAGELRDINPWVEGVQGMPTATQVRGIGAIDTAFTWPEEDNGGAPLYGKAVALSLSSGFVQLVEEGSGCFLRDLGGPKTLSRSGNDITTNFDGVVGAATLQGNGTNNRAVQVNPCGGTAWTESWRVRYDQTEQAWLVEGSLSGEQDTRAHEDVRYVSDNGQVSFLIRSGATPSMDGWAFEFNVSAGLLVAEGDNDLDGQIDVPLDLPGDPIGFSATPPDELQMGWELAEPLPFVLVAAEGADLVARVDARDGSVSPWW